MTSLPASNTAPSPQTSPFVKALLGEERSALLSRLVEGLDSTTLHWLSGYLAGVAAQAPLQASAPTPVPQAVPDARLTIVYGTQTGNSRLLAERLKRHAESSGLTVRTLRAGEYPVKELREERLLYVVISTQGDGDPPDDARGFCEFILGKRAPKLEQLRFAVLGLGDSSYPKYCEVSRVLDARLAELGATRLLDRADCDVDFEPVAKGWIDQAVNHATETLKARATTNVVTLPRSAPPAPTFSREAPYAAELLANQRITGRGALKDVRHIEVSLGDSGLSYEPGDSLGVWPHNPPELVAEFLAELKLQGEAEVSRDGRTLPLRLWLSEELELTKLSRPFLERHAALARSTELQRLLTPEGSEAFRALLKSHQVIDLLRQWSAPWSAEELVRALRRLTPRMYSLASSQKRVGAEAHLTVAVVDYQAFGTRHLGAASSYLSTRNGDTDKVRVFVEHNERFRLPRESERDILMIGPGTGVAPFRAFVQERAESGAKGRNWLFFGEQHFRTQFLYQTEWQEALKQGSLNRLSLAFSRDQEKKIYVQDRLREAGRDVYAWLEGGASLYVCGEAQKMAPDVHAALIDIISTHGGRSREDAAAWLDTLREQQRYQRDIY
ncbi:assimilatory sulfite reductase (NADPH) flavoprotein subunit [Hyalangium rubrum]|uniref:Assimilatory sulfite reductase (NADPH) flavoprotein subunit n=1 Tax=Hyalangium rubrum TaxID=3103134 RepID=A0ABU5GYB9_9BACT|nr:assimilatory sulfite reductase (NADPH) flavoprotein subunit [Hyalangium sp. s54d21]MDY7225689.1 assimilatory sulfite reductase (NADPH) flavoprotein subunit [Hyalangium sp. s54d21]